MISEYPHQPSLRFALSVSDQSPNPPQDPSDNVRHDLLKMNQLRQIYKTTQDQWERQVDPRIQLSIEQFCTFAALSEVFPDLATAEMARTLHKSIMRESESDAGRRSGRLVSGIGAGGMSFGPLSNVCKLRFGSKLEVKRVQTILPPVAKDLWCCTDPERLKERVTMLSEDLMSRGETVALHHTSEVGETVSEFSRMPSANTESGENRTGAVVSRAQSCSSMSTRFTIDAGAPVVDPRSFV